MPNPVFVNCPKNVWTKVATNVNAGFIHKVYLIPYSYLQTYRLTGEAAPTLKSDGVMAFEHSITEEISATAGIDVYLYPITAGGRVRVDL